MSHLLLDFKDKLVSQDKMWAIPEYSYHTEHLEKGEYRQFHRGLMYLPGKVVSYRLGFSGRIIELTFLKEYTNGSPCDHLAITMGQHLLTYEIWEKVLKILKGNPNIQVGACDLINSAHPTPDFLLGNK